MSIETPEVDIDYIVPEAVTINDELCEIMDYGVLQNYAWFTTFTHFCYTCNCHYPDNTYAIITAKYAVAGCDYCEKFTSFTLEEKPHAMGAYR